MADSIIETSIRSYRHREKEARRRAVDAIMSGSYSVAALATQEAATYAACAEELAFQREYKEANYD